MVIIGLTGTIGAGKSTIMRWLAERGACTVDADQLTREVQQPGEPAYAAIVNAFGDGILLENGEIDRAALGARVFADGEELRRLEAIVHPAVYTRFAERVAACRASILVVEAIKLLETGRLVPFCNEIWVVTVSERVQLERLERERGMSESEARRRIANQMPQEERVRRATRVIDNDGTPEQLYAQLAQIWSEVTEKYNIVAVSLSESPATSLP